jgi:titin
MVHVAEESMAFTKDLSDVRITRLPATASFQCELSRPNVPVTWYKDGEPLRKSPRVSVDSEGRIHRLTVKNVESADEGTYSCSAKNMRTSAKLSVQSE